MLFLRSGLLLLCVWLAPGVRGGARGALGAGLGGGGSCVGFAALPQTAVQLQCGDAGLQRCNAAGRQEEKGGQAGRRRRDAGRAHGVRGTGCFRCGGAAVFVVSENAPEKSSVLRAENEMGWRGELFC